MKNWKKSAVAPVVLALCLVLVGAALPAGSSAEPAAPESMLEPAPWVMTLLPWSDTSIRVAPPQQFRAVAAPTATITINYLPAGTPDGQGASCLAWTASAQAAFSYAASIWASLITSNVPIRINACWANLGSPTTLGYSWSNMRRNFTGGQTNTWYSNSLADALAGVDLDPSVPDSYITYNNGFSWYFGTDGNTPAGQVDFVSVVLHELGHSLNFSGVVGYGSSQCGNATYGCWGYNGSPGIYDRFTETGGGQPIIGFSTPSAALGTALTGGDLWFDGTNANAANGGNRVRLYAPSPWKPGSSYAHLDYNTFKDTAHRLMVYAIPSGASIHHPGTITLGLLKDLGWNPVVPNPVPSITGLNPSSAAAGDPAFTLTVNGTNFISTSEVRWNGSERTTSYVSPTQLTAQITAADIAAATAAAVTVFNPAPGGGTSNSASFTVTGNPVPAIGGLNPFSAMPGGPAFTLTVNGTNFIGNSKVRWNGSERTTTYVSPMQLTAAIAAADIATPGTAQVTVFSPGPGGGTSKWVGFIIGEPRKAFLPLAMKDFTPPVPAAPVLNAIANPDGDGNYTVSWTASAGATGYLLQEDDNAGFSSPETRYSGAGTTWDAAGKAAGTYYYRVQATNTWGASGWSNVVQCVVVGENNGINGRVTYLGAAASGIQLQLRFYNGSEWSTAATTATGADGRYRFMGAATLGPGQEYYVRFGPNTTNSAYLYAWWALTITEYVSGTTVPGGDFDIADVNLLSPADGASTHLPVTFTWQTRGIATDTYSVILVDPSTGALWITNDLGNVGSATLGLPPGAVYDHQYRWWVEVYNGPDSFGDAFDDWGITFLSGAGSSAVASEEWQIREKPREPGPSK